MKWSGAEVGGRCCNLQNESWERFELVFLS